LPQLFLKVNRLPRRRKKRVRRGIRAKNAKRKRSVARLVTSHPQAPSGVRPPAPTPRPGNRRERRLLRFLSWGTKWLNSRVAKYLSTSVDRASARSRLDIAKNGGISEISAALNHYRGAGKVIPLSSTTREARRALTQVALREVRRQKDPILGGDFRRSFKAHVLGARMLASHKVLKKSRCASGRVALRHS